MHLFCFCGCICLSTSVSTRYIPTYLLLMRVTVNEVSLRSVFVLVSILSMHENCKGLHHILIISVFHLKNRGSLLITLGAPCWLQQHTQIRAIAYNVHDNTYNPLVRPTMNASLWGSRLNALLNIG